MDINLRTSLYAQICLINIYTNLTYIGIYDLLYYVYRGSQLTLLLMLRILPELMSRWLKLLLSISYILNVDNFFISLIDMDAIIVIISNFLKSDSKVFLAKDDFLRRFLSSHSNSYLPLMPPVKSPVIFTISS